MHVTVKFFAVLRDRAGVPEMRLEIPEGSTVAAASELLVQRLPALRSHTRSAGFAVNLAYVPPHTLLKDGDELALIPPVSGG